MISSAIVLLLAYALVGGEEHPGIAANAGELARNAAHSEGAPDEVDARGESAREAYESESGSFAEYDIGEYAPEPEAGMPQLPEGLPSSAGDRDSPPVPPEMAEEALAQDIAEAIRAQGGN